MTKRLAPTIALAAALVLTGCVGSRPPTRTTSSAFDFLYPGGATEAAPPREVALRLPVRVGIAFAPQAQQSGHIPPLTEQQKLSLLEAVAGAFRGHEGIGRIEVVPSAHLRGGGGFENLDRVAAALGLDLMVLLSWDQAQFTEGSRASWTYLTVVGPLLIEGEKNDTRTVVEAAVYDIPSRTLLFRASGQSSVKGRSSPLNVDAKRRKHAGQGFEQATRDLIAGLETGLAEFEEQAKSGTVHGPGTPALAFYDAAGRRLEPGSGAGGSGAGALDPAALAGAAALALAALGRRRRS